MATVRPTRTVKRTDPVGSARIEKKPTSSSSVVQDVPSRGLQPDHDGPQVAVEVEQLAADLVAVDLGLERPARRGVEVEHPRGS